MPDAPAAPSQLTNATIDQIAQRLASARRVVVLTHAKPDGDAVGSTLALVRAINRVPSFTTRPKAEAWYFGPSPAWLRDIAIDGHAGAGATETPIRVFEPPFIGLELPPHDDVDAVVITDTCSWMQVEPMRAWIEARNAMTSVVDHHVQGDPGVGSLRFVDTSAAAVVQPVALLCQALLGVSGADKLPASVAEPLYLGLCTDTGWFRHSNVSRRVMTLAGELLEAGANHIRLYQLIEQCETPGRLRLISRALASMELRLNDRLAFLTLTMKDLRESGANPGETGGITDFTQGIPTVMVSAILIETPSEKAAGPIIKISMRAKSEPMPVDVNAIASTFGGGGHVRAAGAKVTMSMEETKEAITRLVQAQLSR
jgi:phosphoesterase RecJ-like protein